MTRLRVTIAAGSIAFTGLLLSLCAADGRLRIGIVGDQTGVDMADPAQITQNLDQSYKILADGVALLKSKNVAAVLHVGDLLEDSRASSEDQYAANFEKAASLLDRLGSRWFLTPGDHDVNPPTDYTPSSPNRTDETYFQRAYSKHEPAVRTNLYYSFEVQSYHFIALDSLEHLRTDPRWGDIFLAELSEKQYAWLAADLRAHRNAPGIVVFMHQPLWYNSTAWPTVHRLLRQYPVRAVIAGHFHYCQDEGTLDGIRYMIVGATGADTKQGSASAGNLQHVSVLTLDGSRPVDIKLLSITKMQPEPPFGTRPDMDRVQALDVMLDNNYSKYYDQFGPYNPLCVDAGQVYGGTAHAPARLKLLPLGNPLDVPLRVTVKLASKDWEVDNPAFQTGPNACALQPDGSCMLEAGSRIYSSNNSSVTMPGNGSADPQPLWQSGLRVGSKPIGAVTPVSLELRVSFDGTNGHYELYRILRSTPSGSCPTSAHGGEL